MFLFTGLLRSREVCAWRVEGIQIIIILMSFVLAFTSLNIATKPAYFYEQTVLDTLFFPPPRLPLFKKRKKKLFNPKGCQKLWHMFLLFPPNFPLPPSFHPQVFIPCF